jgi:hypothetical protein
MPTVELTTFFVILHVPKGQPVSAIRRVLERRSFRKQLHRAVEELVKQHPALKPLTLSVTR